MAFAQETPGNTPNPDEVFSDPNTENGSPPETLPPNPLPDSQTPPNSNPSGQLPTDSVSSQEPAPFRSGFTCANDSLDPKERQKLWDETLNKGFVGKELSSGTPANKNRDKTNQEVLILPNADDKLAIKQKIPNELMEPSELAFILNTYQQGAFAFGLLLSDSVRIGKCSDFNASCGLIGKNLNLRNSGSGITANVKNVFKDAWSVFKPEEDVASPEGFSEDEAAYVRAELLRAGTDNSQLDYQTAQRIETTFIPNSILTDTFSASMNSNCTNSACYINTYSLFDKLFNAYASTNMLIGAFGPSLFNGTRRAFGWTGSRLPFFKIDQNPLVQRLRSLYMRPEGLYYKFVANRQYRRVQQEVLPLDNIIAEKSFVIEGGGFNANWNPTIQNHLLKEYPTRESKGKVYRYLTEQRRIARVFDTEAQIAQAELAAVTKQFPNLPNHPQVIAARVKAAGRMGRMYDVIDDDTGIDIPKWMANHKSVNFNRYAVKRMDTGEFVQPAVESDYMDAIFRKLNDTQNFRFVPGDITKYKTVLSSTGDNLDLFAPSVKGSKFTSVTRDTIQDAAAQGNHANAFARLDDETFVPFNKNNVDYILKKSAGDIELYRGGWEKIRDMSPEEMANLLLGPKIAWRTGAWTRNSNTMVQWARENNWQFRTHYANLLDRAAAYEDNLIKTYLDPKGGLKWTAYPFAFWGFKRGFGGEQFSLYQLPDTWSTLEVYLGQSRLYDDAFIDFFANEGSDQGDVFVAFLNKLPWKMILNKIGEEFSPVNTLFKQFTQNELRSETGNLITFVSGPSDCAGCGLTLKSQNLRTFEPNFFARQKLQTFILEDTPNDQEEVGQTLIAYARHTNLKGSTKDITGGKVDLDEAIQKKETCRDKVESLPGGKLLMGVLPSTASFGGALAFGENIAYGIFTWGGFLASAAQQVLIAPELQDCVDTEEGYYVHFFAPALAKSKDSEGKEEIGTQKISNLVKDGTDRVLDALQGKPQRPPGEASLEEDPTITEKAGDDLRARVDELVQNAETKDLVEAVVTTEGFSAGRVAGNHLFYLWTQGNSDSSPSKYRTEGKAVITDGDISVENDFKDGKVRVNGKDVITNPDIARLASNNLQIPATEYPNNLTRVGLPTDSTEIVFSMDHRGETLVLNSEVLECIRRGVEFQTGVPMNSDNLSEVFGPTLAIVTDTHPNVFPDTQARRIIAEGVPRKVAEGDSAKAEVLASTQTLLTPVIGGTPDVGRMTSIQFKNGVIIYKPQTNELIVWLKRNEKAILGPNDVDALKATKTTSKNPENNCEEPAIDLEVTGNPNSELSQFKAGLFNQGLQHMGPFKIFDTPSKRFVFYSKLENGACQDYFKVIDKATGETLVDAPIASLEQTPTGVKVTTDDGKEHTLDFSAENGRPILTYNGQPETLVSAQGENGAFWYDPDKGLWYTENAQLLPLIEAFKKLGIGTQVGEDGRVTGQANGNVLNLQVGGESGLGLNLPSIPENAIALLLFILLLVGSMMAIRAREIKHPKKPD